LNELIKTLRGLNINIHTIGIISAENPMGIESSINHNKEATESLKSILTTGRWGYRPVVGKYGSVENSFIVNNISLDDLLNLGKRFKQESVIFASRIKNREYIGMKFQLIRTDDEIGKIEGTQNIFISRKDSEDFYTQYRGRKFIIPFYGTLDISGNFDDWDKIIDNDYTNSIWIDGEYSKPISRVYYKNRKTGDEISEIEFLELSKLEKESTKKSGLTSFNYRGKIRSSLKRF
jgi:hypothetical protein